MKIDLKRAVLSIAAAAAMIISSFAVMTAISPTTVQAASAVSISVSPSASSVEPGKSFTVSVGYNPGTSGAAAYDIILHYDSSKLTLSSYSYDSSPFALAMGNSATGTVSLSGVNVSNVTSSGTLGSATFTAASNASGSASFWIEIVDVTDASGTAVSVSAPTSSSPTSITIAAATTTTTTTTTTTAKVTEAPKATTTTPKVTEAPKATTTTPKVTTEEVTETTEEESEIPEEDPEEEDPDAAVAEVHTMSLFVQNMQYSSIRSTHSLQFNNACLQLAYCLNGGANISG